MYYRIEWKSKITGHKGHGSWFISSKNLQSCADSANRSHPELHHWIASTEFLVLNGINQGKEILNQYKPSTVF